MIRMARHSAGTYRVHDGRGGGGSGNRRVSPPNSWLADNANPSKARPCSGPSRKNMQAKLSWADLVILAGNGLETMG